jgi:hypothetical protein
VVVNGSGKRYSFLRYYNNYNCKIFVVHAPGLQQKIFSETLFLQKLPRACIAKLFGSLIKSLAQYAPVSGTVKPFHPSLVFAGATAANIFMGVRYGRKSFITPPHNVIFTVINSVIL